MLKCSPFFLFLNELQVPPVNSLRTPGKHCIIVQF